jgi:hypothetical protein
VTLAKELGISDHRLKSGDRRPTLSVATSADRPDRPVSRTSHRALAV